MVNVLKQIQTPKTRIGRVRIADQNQTLQSDIDHRDGLLRLEIIP